MTKSIQILRNYKLQQLSVNKPQAISHTEATGKQTATKGRGGSAQHTGLMVGRREMGKCSTFKYRKKEEKKNLPTELYTH